MKYTCQFCGYSSDDIYDFEADYKMNQGFWCPDCDGFTYYQQNPSNQHSFLLFLENKNEISTEKCNSKIKFHSHVSPLRYPGGKSKVIPQIYEKCNKNHLENFVEPYAGGASVGISLLLSGLVKSLYLNDLDFGVYSLFEVIKIDPESLCTKIKAFIPNQEAFYKAKEVISSNYKDCDILEAAWNLFIVNRLAFSGISKANCMSNPSARWNPDALIKRISAIHNISDHIFVSNENAIDFIEEKYWLYNATILIDPPYYFKGKDLYHCYYEKLAFLLDNLYKGMPGADMIVTYDMAEQIKSIYDYPDI